MRGCAKSCSDNVGVNVQSTRVTIASVFWSSVEKTYRVPYVSVASGSTERVTNCAIACVRLNVGSSEILSAVDGRIVATGWMFTPFPPAEFHEYEVNNPYVYRLRRSEFTWN